MRAQLPEEPKCASHAQAGFHVPIPAGPGQGRPQIVVFDLQSVKPLFLLWPVEMRLGLMTDKRLHPLAEDGSAPYSNLYAAGALLGGYDYSGPCGFGVPILTGWLAGQYASK